MPTESSAEALACRATREQIESLIAAAANVVDDLRHIFDLRPEPQRLVLLANWCVLDAILNDIAVSINAAGDGR